jgi:hypothetical protein
MRNVNPRLDPNGIRKLRLGGDWSPRKADCNPKPQIFFGKGLDRVVFLARVAIRRVVAPPRKQAGNAGHIVLLSFR